RNRTCCHCSAYFVCVGPFDPSNGRLINISEIKKRAVKIVRERFDHKFLNKHNPSFCDVTPTAENIARQLHLDVAPLFSDVDATLAASHVSESPERSATFYFDGGSDTNYWFEFSAARETVSPPLNKEQYVRSFG